MPKREREVLQLSVGESDKVLLEEIARELKYVRGNQANLTALVTAIARREIPLFPSSTLSAQQQEALVQAIFALRERGALAQTKDLAAWCLSKKELLPEYRVRLDGTFGFLLEPWLLKVEEQIDNQQPFKLSYQDAAGRLWTYTIRYAELAFREKRNYLECWCEETEGNQDLISLQHNWSLRLDRIADAGVVPVDGKWLPGLDTVEIELKLFGGLAYAYQQRDADIFVEWLSVEPPIKRVVRRISNTFWLLREVLPYGKDCVVLSPEGVRSRIKEQLSDALRKYGA